jgi:dTDP-4-amino-4,6-dideoxygalactose transaminase
MSEVRGADYESASARSIGARHAIAFAFARHGLSSTLVCAGLTRGNEVALSPLTCKVVPLALLAAGLRPVYVDVSAGTLNLDPLRLPHRLGPNTRAIMFQHTYGSDEGLEDVARLAEQQQLLLVEDCAQCLPVTDGAYAPGRLGRAAIFSNNLLKPLPAGSGGLVTTNDDTLADSIREARDRLPLRSWGAEVMLGTQTWLYRRTVRPASYWMILETYKRLSASYGERPLADELVGEIDRLAFRPSPVQFEEGARWLEQLTAIADHRRACCADYQERLSRQSSVALPPIVLDRPLLYFPVLTPRKRATLDAARAKRLPIIPWPGSTPIYPLERLEALRSYGYEPGSCPIAESIASRLIGLPTERDITAEHRKRIAALVTEVAAA